MIIVYYIERIIFLSEQDEMVGGRWKEKLPWQIMKGKEGQFHFPEGKTNKKMSFYNGEQAQNWESEVPRFYQRSRVEDS